ncbi:putative glycine-rich cell wall structural protein 1 [Triticum aestivum]|uniref:putative glycine-rich cell wall structural protein 1 n=1 Tax=Triticum aestivum TaxID=4565 RepID=UPI001D018301|nr:putative glycine-rich cell wall structural protein 1 [Triticum aestivum]
MADKGKGKAVDDTAGTSSRTSGRTETAGGGGTHQDLPLGISYQFSGAPGGGGGTGLSQSQLRIPTTTVQQPLSNQARGSAPFGGQNQIANPQFAGGGGGGGSGAGFGGSSQFEKRQILSLWSVRFLVLD